MPVKEILTRMGSFLVVLECGPDIQSVDDGIALAVLLEVDPTCMSKGGKKIDRRNQSRTFPVRRDEPRMSNDAWDAGAALKG